jgi:hypothetical protein
MSFLFRSVHFGTFSESHAKSVSFLSDFEIGGNTRLARVLPVFAVQAIFAHSQTAAPEWV